MIPLLIFTKQGELSGSLRLPIWLQQRYSLIAETLLRFCQTHFLSSFFFFFFFFITTLGTQAEVFLSHICICICAVGCQCVCVIAICFLHCEMTEWRLIAQSISRVLVSILIEGDEEMGRLELILISRPAPSRRTAFAASNSLLISLSSPACQAPLAVSSECVEVCVSARPSLNMKINSSRHAHTHTHTHTHTLQCQPPLSPTLYTIVL